MKNYAVIVLLALFGASAHAGELMHGFKLVRTQEIKEIGSTANLYEHVKSGAKLLYLTSEDDNKVFSISFRTPPANDTGLPHILEHSVLCGSRKFPSKEPFLELVKGSVKTFVNAMTYPDKTIYPVASRNDKDFKNLMDVYLDAVFFPNIHKDPLILKQEGWRYDIDEKTGELAYNGVVFNEMKGVFSSPEAVLERKTYHALFPKGTYSWESGGEPEFIPQLTQKMFTDFHKKYYHPSNSLILIYGNGDCEAHLKFLNEEYLNLFEKTHIDSEIVLPKAKPRPIEVSEVYSVNKGDSLKDKSYLAQAYGIGDATDPELVMGMDILAQILLQTDASPLKRALVEAGVGQEVDGDFDAGIKTPMLFIRAKKTEPGKKALFKKVIEKTLTNLVKNGIDRKLIEASLNRKEFYLRELEFRRYPKGLVFTGMVLESWLYEGDPLVRLQFEPVLAKIKKEAYSGYFEKLIQKHLLGNPHRALLTLTPRVNLDEQRSRKVAAELKKLKKSLSKAELEEIIAVSKSLKKKQQTPDSPEDLAKIPVLEIKDIDPKAEVLPLEHAEVNGVPFLLHDLPTNKIGYVNLLFDAGAVPEELIPYVSLLSEILGKVDTRKFKFGELTNEINAYLGGLGFESMPVSAKDSLDKFLPKFRVRGKALLERLPKLYELTEEVLLNSKFDDKKRIREIIQETKSGQEHAIVSSGNYYAGLRIQSYFSAAGKYQELTSGLKFYHFLVELDASYDKKSNEVVQNLKKVSQLLFNRNQLIVSFTGEKSDFKLAQPGLKKFVGVFPAEKLPLQKYKFETTAVNEGLVIPSKVQFVASGADYRKLGFEYTGAMQVLKNILSRDYLWNRVRVQGGAYGASADIGRSGQFIFSSYRDPNLQETFEAYAKAFGYIRDFGASDREMTKFVLGTVSQLDMPLTPSLKGETSDYYYLMGLSQKEIQKSRDQILGTRQKDIRALAEMVNQVVKKGNIAVIGSEGKIQQNKARFGKISSIIK